jgi:plastocyanin
MKSAFASLLVLGASLVQATQYTVTVGANGELAFNPDTITAAAGDTVAFQFLGGVKYLIGKCLID